MSGMKDGGTSRGTAAARGWTVNYNDGMLALRYAALLAIVVWVGGLVALGAIAAPAIFDVVASRHMPEGRLLAGAIFGEILRQFHHVSYICGAVIPLSLTARAVLGPRPRRFALRVGAALVMLGAVGYSGLVISPRIERLQQTTGAAPSSLPEGDPRRVEFGRLHGMSTGVQLVPLLGGLLLLFFEARD
jgi:hypothetical protein